MQIHLPLLHFTVVHVVRLIGTSIRGTLGLDVPDVAIFMTVGGLGDLVWDRIRIMYPSQHRKSDRIFAG